MEGRGGGGGVAGMSPHHVGMGGFTISTGPKHGRPYRKEMHY